MHIEIHPEGWVEPRTPTGHKHLSWGVKAGNLVQLAGILSTDPATGDIVGVGDIRVQAHRVLDSIKAALEAGGARLEDVTLNQIFLRDMADYDVFNEVYVQYFSGTLPARFCVKLEMVKPEFLLEITTTAIIPQ